jgi:hypothetical protein
MKLEGNGVLKSEDGDTIAEVYYTVAPGRRLRTAEAGSEDGGGSLAWDKTGLDSIRLVAKQELALTDIPTRAVLETEDGRRFSLMITTTLVPPMYLLEATATEIED